jgi:acyl carrier protein
MRPATEDIKSCIVENFAPDVAPADLPEDYDLLGTGLITSLDLVKLITLLSRRFDIDIDAADVRPENFQTIHSINEFISAASTHS